MGKPSRRRAAASTPAAPVTNSPQSANVEAAKVGSLGQWFQMDRWEQVVLMFLCVSVTMNFLGNYIPGLKVLMESEIVGYAGSAVSVTGMTGLAYSLFGPGQHLSRMQAARTKAVPENAGRSTKRKEKKA